MTPTAERLRIYRAYIRLPPEIGGMERHIASLTAAQRAQGVEVVNIFNRGTPEGPASRILPHRNLARVRPAMVRDLLFYAAARTALEPVHDGRANVLHVHGDWSAFLAARLLSPVLKPIVTVASIHGKARRSAPFYRAALASHAVIFATGFGEAVHLAQWTGKQVHHLPSAPLDLFFEKQSPLETQADVIAVGNLLPNKRNDLLVQCALRRPALKFSLYGDGPERASLEALVRSSGCGNIRIHGKADPRQVASALQSARLFVNLSETEGTPTAALEAMACGLPVVLTPSNDYSWLIRDGSNGYVTAGWSIEEILNRIDLCLGDEAKRQDMSNTNRTIAHRHRWSAKADFVTERIIESIARATS